MSITDIFKPEKEKPIVNTEILKKKYNIDKKYLLIPLILLVFFFINREYFMFGVLTILSGAFSFYHDKYNRTPIDLKMPLFLGIFITRYFGLHFTVIFFILSDVIPGLLGGGRIEGTTLIFYLWFLVINAVVLLFPGADIIVLGIILVIVEFFGSIVIKSFFGIPGVVAVASSIMSVIVRVIYFLTLGGILRFFLQGLN